MKTLHTTELQTAVGSRARTAVREIPTGAGPVREISVIADAVLTVAEARQLITDLQHAVALAEELDARPDCQDCDCRQWTWNGHSHLLRSDPPSACICGHETVRHHSEGLPVSEDQPKPRVWHRGDVPGPLRYSVVNVARLVVTEEFAATTFVMRKLDMSFAAAEAALSCLETWGVVRPTTGSKSRDVADIPVEQLDDLVAELSEVLADSEQVTRGR